MADYEHQRTQAILQAVLDRLKWLDCYTGNNDTHRGIRLAVSLIRCDLNRARQKIPKEKQQILP